MSATLSRRLLALLVAVSALGGLTPTAQADRAARKAMWGPLLVNGASEFPTYQKLGVGIYEMDLLWASTARTRPRKPDSPRDAAYHWDPQLDYAVKQAARYHMQVLLEVSQTPSGPTAPTAYGIPRGIPGTWRLS